MLELMGSNVFKSFVCLYIGIQGAFASYEIINWFRHELSLYFNMDRWFISLCFLIIAKDKCISVNHFVRPSHFFFPFLYPREIHLHGFLKIYILYVEFSISIWFSWMVSYVLSAYLFVGASLTFVIVGDLIKSIGFCCKDSIFVTKLFLYIELLLHIWFGIVFMSSSSFLRKDALLF